MKTTIDYTLTGVVALEIQAASAKHPNHMKFSGVLVRVDEPSTKAPHGSDGHKILIPSKLAAAKLDTLKNMPLNYHPSLNQHQQDRPVGVIKAAKLVGKDIVVSGVIWKKSFPDSVKDLNSAKLGMSFEASDITVQDKKAAVWTLSDMCFTGATILYKDSAAYFNTSAQALAAAASSKVIDLPFTLVANSESKGAIMATKAEKLAAKKLRDDNKKKADLKASADQAKLVAALTAAMAPIVAALNANTEAVQGMHAAIDEHFVDADSNDDDVDVDASEDDDDDDDVSAADDKKAAKKKAAKKDDNKDDDDEEDDDDDDDMESGASDDEDDLDNLSDDDDDDDMTPGHLNPKTNIANKGSKVPNKPAGKGKKNMKSSAADAAALARLTRQNKKLRETVAAQAEAIEAAAENVDRRSVTNIEASSVLRTTLAKGNLDAASLVREGQKVTVAELDAMAASMGASTVQSFAMKNEATRLGILQD